MSARGVTNYAASTPNTSLIADSIVDFGRAPTAGLLHFLSKVQRNNSFSHKLLEIFLHNFK